MDTKSKGQQQAQRPGIAPPPARAVPKPPPAPQNETTTRGAQSPQPTNPTTKEIVIRIPIGKPREGYAVPDLDSGRVDMKLSSAQHLAIEKILGALDESRAKLANGKYVQNKVDAVRWVLERVAELAAA